MFPSKLLLGKGMFFIDIRLSWTWNQYFQLGYFKWWSY